LDVAFSTSPMCMIGRLPIALTLIKSPHEKIHKGAKCLNIKNLLFHPKLSGT